MAVSPTGLLLIIAAAVGLAIVWALVVDRPVPRARARRDLAGQHLVGSLLVVLLALGVAAPPWRRPTWPPSSATSSPGCSGTTSSRRPCPTAPRPTRGADKDRVNVLLLGGDGRVRPHRASAPTASSSPASTPTPVRRRPSACRATSRNLPFPANSPLRKVYPHGFDAGAESESLLNAVYRNGPTAHPDILGPTDNPGADFLKLGVGEALGLTIDYFVLVNLDGFSQLIDALGGITVNVNYYVPDRWRAVEGLSADAYIAPGPNQHMDGERALAYARGRFGLSDYMRHGPQRCMINAIVTAADPVDPAQSLPEDRGDDAEHRPPPTSRSPWWAISPISR
jgi:LCP family protein required for cell wall assembly